jgi:hypothetical protein
VVARPVRVAGPGPGLRATGHVPAWAERLAASAREAFEPAHQDGAADPADVEGARP